MFYRYIHGLYLLFTVWAHCLWYFSSNFIMSILFYLISILLSLNLSYLWRILHDHSTLRHRRLHIPSNSVINEISDEICDWLLLNRLQFILFLDNLENFCHILFEVIKVGFFLFYLKRGFFIYFGDNIIEHTHNQVIIVSTLSIFKDDTAIRKVVVA